MTADAANNTEELQPSSGSAIEYVAAMDGMRGIAILLVVWCHGPEVLRLVGAWQNSLFWHLSNGGAMGVDLFFGVSGFLITSILLKTREQERSLVKFWARRALRIFPLHYLYLVVLVVASALVPDLWPSIVPVEGAMWLPYFLYVGNLAILLMGHVGTPLIILWSLAVEEQFYFVWPLVISKASVREVAKFCIVGVVMSPVLRFFAQYGEEVAQTSIYLTVCRLDPIFWGALIAVGLRDATWRGRMERLGPRLGVPVVLSALGLFYWSGTGGYEINLPFTVVGRTLASLTVAACVVIALFPGRIARSVLESRIAIWVGRRSYGIYIWHVLLGFTLTTVAPSLLELPELVALGIWTACTLVVAQLSWMLFEGPMLRLKRHFAYK